MEVIYIVGMGPGRLEAMTQDAREAIANADVVVGYKAYIEIAKQYFPDKDYQTTGMTKEIERCELCYELASQGKRVALICSGDAGVYGMASPMLEMAPKYPGAELVVVPGVTAANSGAAVLGAPLAHDFCVISLSDLLTPWELIEKRLQAAIYGDFAIALYNPSSKKRADYLAKACRIMLDAGASPSRVCGYVENIGREGTSAKVCTLDELSRTQVNMFTTVFIGNSQSVVVNGKLVTKRGYK